MESDARLDVRFFAPPPDLAQCFTSFYRVELKLRAGEQVEDQLQPEWGNLRFFANSCPVTHVRGRPPLEGARFTATGPSAHPAAFTLGKSRLWGIGLLPLGWARFVGSAAADHADTIVNGETSPVFAQFAPLCRHLCTASGDDERQLAAITGFFRRHGKMPRDAAGILAVHEAMLDPNIQHIGEFADRAQMSKRTLERVCHRHFGFSPQVLLRRQRLMRTLAAFMLAPRATWSNMIDPHYHDQAHFVHEFQHFMGMTPGEYARQPHPVLKAFMAERQRVWGSPVQTLDRPRSEAAQ